MLTVQNGLHERVLRYGSTSDLCIVYTRSCDGTCMQWTGALWFSAQSRAGYSLMHWLASVRFGCTLLCWNDAMTSLQEGSTMGWTAATTDERKAMCAVFITKNIQYCTAMQCSFNWSAHARANRGQVKGGIRLCADAAVLNAKLNQLIYSCHTQC